MKSFTNVYVNQSVSSNFRECANGQALRCFFSFPLYVGTQWMYVYKDGCGSSFTCAACSHMFACTWRVEAMKVLFFEYFPPCLWDGIAQRTWIFKICLICLANELSVWPMSSLDSSGNHKPLVSSVSRKQGAGNEYTKSQC